MRTPLELPMKVVGRRVTTERGLEDARTLQRTLRELRPTEALVPRGLYRFRTFEEAEAWMIREMIATLARHKSPTSPESVGP